MNYIKPRTAYIKIELSNVVMGSKKETEILDPSINLGENVGGGNIVMAKGAWDLSETDDNGWPKTNSPWDD